MPTAEQGSRRTGGHQFRILGLIKEATAITWDGGRGIGRKVVPWEKMPITGERTKKTIGNALTETYTWLKTQPDLAGDLSTIFGDSINQGLDVPIFSDVKQIGKGWNSIAYSFTSNGRKWVVKLGAFTSPDNIFFPPPNKESHSQELKQNLAIVQEGMREENIDLPEFVSLPQVIHYADFRNAGGRRIKRTIHIVPFEEIVPLEKVAEKVRSNPNIARDLQKDFREYEKLRSWMIQKYRSDFDLHGADNIAVVATGRQDHPYVIKVLDLGLRIHGLNTPIGDFAFDFIGTFHGANLRRAIKGEEPRKKGEKRADYFERWIPDFLEESSLMIEGSRLRRGIREQYFAGLVIHFKNILAGESNLDGTPTGK